MNNNKIDLANFDFTQFQKEAIDKLKSGQSLTGKDGILTPLIKEIIEAALEDEMDSHLQDWVQLHKRVKFAMAMQPVT